MVVLGTKSQTDSVRTPKWLLSDLKKEFGPLFDPAPFNPKFDKSKHVDGLKISWKKANFVNPPYSSVGPWVRKAHSEWKQGKTVIMLVKLESLGRKYSKLIQGAEIRILTDKISFPGYKKTATFNSILLIFRANKRSNKYKLI